MSTETGKMKRLLIAFIVAPLIGLGAAGAVLASIWTSFPQIDGQSPKEETPT